MGLNRPFRWLFVKYDVKVFDTEHGTSYFIILPHNTTQKSFVITFIFIPFLRNNFTTCNALSQMSRQIINTPHQCHYSGYVLIYYALCSGVFKDCEAPFSLKNNLNLRSYMWLPVLVVYLQVLWNSHVLFIWMQSLSLKPLKQNQMYFQSIWSKISFRALYSFFFLHHSVVRYILN